MKLEGNYKFNVLEFYDFIKLTNPGELFDMLGEKIYSNFVKKENAYWMDEEEKASAFDFDGSNYYNINDRNSLITFVNKAHEHASFSVDKVELIEKAKVFMSKDKLLMNIRDFEIEVSEEFVKNFLVAERNYNNVNYSEMKLIGKESAVEENGIIIADDESINDVELSVEKVSSEIAMTEELLAEEIKEIEKMQELEIRKMKEAFALKISKAKLEIAEKIAPLVKDMEGLTDKIVMMESSLYRWLSYNGQSYELKQLNVGDKASDEEKLNIWQKIRYLDEELPKLVLDNDVSRMLNFGEFRSLEGLMKDYKVVRDFFLPSEKGVIVFQLSRTNIKSTFNQETMFDKNDRHHPWIEFVKKDYEVANWNKLGMFIKNGDNLYVLWMDRDRITINNDNLFLSKNNTEVMTVDYGELRNIDDFAEDSKGTGALENINILKNNYKKRRELFDKFNARLYMTDILQGIIDNEPEVLGLGEEQSVVKAITAGRYENIVFNNADGYVGYTKWNSVDDIIKEISDDFKIGDPIYVLVPSSGRANGRAQYNSYSDDASYNVGQHAINLIDYSDTYYWTKPIDESMIVWNESRGRYELTEQYKYFDIRAYSDKWKKHVNHVEDETSLESWLKAEVVRTFTIDKDTKRIEKIDESRVRNVKINSVRSDGVLGCSEPDMYNMMEAVYYPNAWGVRRYYLGTTIEQVQEKYPGIFKGEDGNFYMPYESNRVYYEVTDSDRYRFLERQGFVHREDLFERKETIYISCLKNWSESGKARANVEVPTNNFLPLKNLTLEHVNYMINQSMKLPGMSNYSDSVKHLLDIRTFLTKKVK